MAKNDPIPDAHELVRWIKRRLLAKADDGSIEVDENGNPLFVFPQAYELREDEEYLSVTSIDLFQGDRPVRIRSATVAIQNSTESKKLSKESAISLAVNATLKDGCLSFGHKVRVLEEPEEDNPAHVAVRRYPRDAPELFQLLADACFVERYLVGRVI